MNKDDIKEVLEETLEPIKKDLQEVKKDLQEVKYTQAEHTKILAEHKEILEERVLPSVITTETTVTGYADAYKTNKANIERLDDRVTKLEDNAGIIPPPEFTIQR